MHELHRDMLGIGGVTSSSKRQKAAAPQEAVRHVAAGQCQAHGLACEEFIEDPVAFEKSFFHPRRENRMSRQHMRGKGSPTSMSITRVPPYPVVPKTVAAGCSRISPIISASWPLGAARSAASP